MSQLGGSAPGRVSAAGLLAYARVGESITPTDPFDRQIVSLFRGFIYLMVLLPCAAAIITVSVMMLRHR